MNQCAVKSLEFLCFLWASASITWTKFFIPLLCVSAQTNQSKLYKVSNCELTAISPIPISIQPFQNNPEKVEKLTKEPTKHSVSLSLFHPCSHFTFLEGPPLPSSPPWLARCCPEIKKNPDVIYNFSHTQHPCQEPPLLIWRAGILKHAAPSFPPGGIIQI